MLWYFPAGLLSSLQAPQLLQVPPARTGEAVGEAAGGAVSTRDAAKSPRTSEANAVNFVSMVPSSGPLSTAATVAVLAFTGAFVLPAERFGFFAVPPSAEVFLRTFVLDLGSTAEEQHRRATRCRVFGGVG